MTPEAAVEELIRIDRAEIRARLESLRLVPETDERIPVMILGADPDRPMTDTWNSAITLAIQTLDEMPPVEIVQAGSVTGEGHEF